MPLFSNQILPGSQYRKIPESDDFHVLRNQALDPPSQHQRCELLRRNSPSIAENRESCGTTTTLNLSSAPSSLAR
ncbi:unnamed protein product, partial [Iphiclides podalirius]